MNQEYYETVMMEEQFMDCWTREYLHAHGEDFYRVDGTTARLRDMPLSIQRSIVNSEYDKVYHP